VAAAPRPGDPLKFRINDVQAQRRGPQRSEDTRRRLIYESRIGRSKLVDAVLSRLMLNRFDSGDA